MDTLKQWQMTELNADFKLVESELPTAKEHEALVKIAGCGVCHTELDEIEGNPHDNPNYLHQTERFAPANGIGSMGARQYIAPRQDFPIS